MRGGKAEERKVRVFTVGRAESDWRDVEPGIGWKGTTTLRQ